MPSLAMVLIGLTRVIAMEPASWKVDMDWGGWEPGAHVTGVADIKVYSSKDFFDPKDVT